MEVSPLLVRQGLWLSSAASTIMLVAGCMSGASEENKRMTEAPTTPPAVISPQRATHSGLESSTEPELRKLAEYEQNYGPITDQLMLFADTPDTTERVPAAATHMAGRLGEFAARGVRPLVVFEPEGLDPDACANGAYDALLKDYFATIKAAGVTDTAMGTWVILPEPNLPEWGTDVKDSFAPATYVACVNHTARVIKSHFPGAQVSLLLNSETVPKGDFAWERVGYPSLLPFVTGIQKGLIDSLGLQGFPWSAAANEPVIRKLDPAVYLNSTLLTDAAKSLGIQKVWFNTGTFARMYAADPSKTITATPDQRREMLAGVLAQAMLARSRGFDTTVNVFAADKSMLGEGTDWSYSRSPEDQTLFQDFLAGTYSQRINLSLFDSTQP